MITLPTQGAVTSNFALTNSDEYMAVDGSFIPPPERAGSSPCQATAKTEPALCIIKCYLQLVSRQDWVFPLSASPFRLIASTPAAALLGLFAIP